MIKDHNHTCVDAPRMSLLPKIEGTRFMVEFHHETSFWNGIGLVLCHGFWTSKFLKLKWQTNFKELQTTKLTDHYRIVSNLYHTEKNTPIIITFDSKPNLTGWRSFVPHLYFSHAVTFYVMNLINWHGEWPCQARW